jgi:hypothetical protein
VSATFSLVLSVAVPSGMTTDVVVRGTTDQTVGELARRVCVYLGIPEADALVVSRTGEHLRPDAPLSSVDLREGDTLTIHPSRSGVVPLRRPR